MASLMADNITATCRAFADHLVTEGIDVEWVDADWELVEEQLDAGTIDLAPICGLGYVRRADLGRPLELFPSPVMKGDRYEGKPIYFSHVRVRADSPFKTFEDLRGKRWVSNEPGSQSGYNLIRAHLYDLGEHRDYFAEEVISGSHLRSMELIASGEVDAGLIDATVFDHQQTHDPALFRKILRLGPSGVPPMVVSTHLPVDLRHRIRQILLGLHEHDQGRHILDLGGLLRFAEVDPHTYESIWAMNEKAKRVRLAPVEISDGYDTRRRHLVVTHTSTSARPAMSRRVLDDIVEGHRLWLAGTGGCRAFLAGANLKGANLEGLDLRRAVIEAADLTGAHLNGTNLEGAELRDVKARGADLRNAVLTRADLQGADLEGARLGGASGLCQARLVGADLEGVRGLTGSEFAGADVTGVVLPETVRDFPELRTVEEISRGSQHLLVVMLLLAAYALLLVATTPAHVLQDPSARVTLPVVGTDLAASSAFLGLPMALGGLFLFFHLSLRRLWMALSALPAVFPDGKTVDERAHPWVLNSVARRHVPVLHARGASKGDILEEVAAIVLGWWLAPAVILVLAGAYLPRADVMGTTLHGVVFVASAWVAFASRRVARMALAGRTDRLPRETRLAGHGASGAP